MPLPDIQLDDRRFEDLVTELRRRIPAYTPEWTDHNDSDPGITLVQLFAGLEDILLWRLNQIPAKAYVKFLQMVGIELNRPQPAQAALTFQLTSKDLPFAVNIPAGTRATLANASGGAPVVFETTDTLFAIGADVAAVQAFDGAMYTVVTEQNRLSDGSFYPFGRFPQANAALYLGLDRAIPPDDVRYFLTVHVDPGNNTPVVKGGPAQPSSPPVIAVWEYYTGGTAPWQPLTVVQDGTNSLTQTGTVQFKSPTGFTAARYGALKKTSDPLLFWLRYRIDQVLGSGYEAPPQVIDVVLNTVGALNAVSNQGELLGASNGLPNQTFQISNVPVLPNPPGVTGIVEVDEGSGFQLWTEVDDFAQADRTSTVYTLNYSTGVVTFGDGEHGKIPNWLSVDGSNREPGDLPNVRVTSYRSGGGAAANAGANTITSLESAIPFVASVTNLNPSFGGADEETVAAAQDRAPQTLRTVSRAVTADDYVFLATTTPGARIARAAALPLSRPDAQLIRPADGSLPPAPLPIPGAVTVIVVPGVNGDPKPEPSADTLGLVAKWLDQHRVVTAELYVTGPVYRLVEIEARVIADTSADIRQVSTDLNNALLAYFHPLTGGQKNNGWGFGESIYVSETYGQILKVDGVQRIDGNLKTYVDGKLQPADADVLLQADELVYSLKHTLDVSYPQ
jgi:uncharacterized phage protein gp47/JayE